ncbi:MAG: HPr family phosphocarrier protein [Hyphomicrobiales bacterium]|jgi:phosphocarrier protein|uniref:HPr family phosphocarrier protein n=1 Tax=Rhabdaerophilum calidifontis TaxID=2604328 RepID=UPI001239C1B4|nr:HPr family phosphocarrier protein [Rhabdaerophilum calidifontis]MCA1952400.1 HPr family phosphocarrier protein [Hyphomicrobiales bacterium]MCA1998147.1 HPr family phosphocarrier protein [Hyphomicrobiales bacterium]
MDNPLDQPCPPPPVVDGALVRELPIINRKGLHARASAKFVQCCEGFEAEIRVTRCGETVGGTSIMGLLTLAAAQGTTVSVSALGPQAKEALDALEALLGNRFGEDE